MTTEPITATLLEYKAFAQAAGWLSLKLTVKPDKVSTIYLTQEGQSLYADFDLKTFNLVSNVDRSMK